jgi:hypothetical protein
MASIQHSTATSRRNVLTVIGAAAAAVIPIKTAAALPATAADVDGVITAWRQLRDLQVEYQSLDDEMREIQEDLPLWVKQPRVLVMVGKPSGREFWASTEAQIEAHYIALPWWGSMSAKQKVEMMAKRDSKVAELEEIKQRAASEYEKAGWTWRDRRQNEIDEAEPPLHKTIDEATGHHPVIIAAKLWHGLTFQCTEMFDDYPARCLVGAIRGLRSHLPSDMRAAMDLITNADGTDDMHSVWRKLAAA